MRVLYVAACTTRNWTLSDDIPRKQINDLWEAIHEIPDLVMRWNEPEKCAAELRMYLREYEAKWPTPKLEAVFKQALESVEAGK